MNVPRFFELRSSGRLMADLVNTRMRSRQEIKNGAFQVEDGPLSFRFHSGNRWQDCIVTVDGILVVTKAVVDGFSEVGLLGFSCFPATIHEVESRSLQRAHPPELFWVKPEGFLNVDEGYLFESEADRLRGHPVFRRVPVIGSWTEGDFLRYRDHHWLRIVCTRRVVEIARAFGLRDFRFVPVDYPLGVGPRYYHEGVDYLSKQWPPQWYPDGFEAAPENLEPLDEYPDPRQSSSSKPVSRKAAPAKPDGPPDPAATLKSDIPLLSFDCAACQHSWSLPANEIAEVGVCPRCATPFRTDGLKLALAHRWLPPSEHPLCGLLYPVSPSGWESRWEVSAGGKRVLPVECSFDRWPDDAQARTFAAIKERFDGVWKKARPMLLEAVGLYDPEARIDAENATLSIEIPEEPLGPETIWQLCLTLEDPDVSWFIDVHNWKPIADSISGAG